MNAEKKIKLNDIVLGTSFNPGGAVVYVQESESVS